MDWDKLKAFYHVARTGSFTKASDIMHRSQSAISRQIRILEEGLRVILFDRKIKPLVLTESGERLFEFVNRIFIDFENIQSDLSMERGILGGNLKIASTIGYAETYITDALPEFLRRNPDLNLSLISTDLETDLILKTVDVSIRPRKKEETKGLIQEFLMQNKIRLYASQKYLDEYGSPKKIEDLDHHKLIAFGDHSGHPFQDLNFHLFLGRDPQNPRNPYLQMNSPRTRCMMAASGLGITSLSEKHHRIEKYNLVEVLPDIDHPTVDIYFIYPEFLKNYLKINIFRDYLKEILPS
jgi:DNA-binding transcriptional LysR family regulator